MQLCRPISAVRQEGGRCSPSLRQKQTRDSSILAPANTYLQARLNSQRLFCSSPSLKLPQTPSCTTSSYLRFTSPFLSSLLWAEHAPGSRPPLLPGPTPRSRAGLWRWALLGGKHIGKLKPQHNSSLSFLCKFININTVY